MALNWPPPQGYPGGGSAPAATVQVANSSVISNTTADSFGYYTLTPAVPSGATAILAVSWRLILHGKDAGFATPDGMYGQPPTSGAVTIVNATGFTIPNNASVGTGGISVPCFSSNAGYSASVVYLG